MCFSCYQKKYKSLTIDNNGDNKWYSRAYEGFFHLWWGNNMAIIKQSSKKKKNLERNISANKKYFKVCIEAPVYKSKSNTPNFSFRTEVLFETQQKVLHSLFSMCSVSGIIPVDKYIINCNTALSPCLWRLNLRLSLCSLNLPGLNVTFWRKNCFY